MSSSLNYLFGNIDKQGKLEKDEGNQDLQEILESKETADYLEKIFETVQVTVSNDENSVKPLVNAVDYQDILEMAEDIHVIPKRLEVQYFKPMEIRLSGTSSTTKSKLKGRVKFSEIFASHIKKSAIEFKCRPLPCNKNGCYPLAVNDLTLFKTPQSYRYLDKPNLHPDKDIISHSESNPSEVLREKTECSQVQHSSIFELNEQSIALSAVMLDPWEEKICWDADQSQGQVVRRQTVQMFRNEHLDGDEWLESIIWDDPQDVKQPPFHMDDPTLVILQSEVDKLLSGKEDCYDLMKKRADGKMINFFNISDDHLNENENSKAGRIRQQHGPIKLQHSLPATKLHPHYFKPLIHVKELRSFHRPTIKFPVNEMITFTRVRAFKRKKFKAVDPTERMKTPKDLTLKDTAKFVLVEYSEEYPPAIQNVGMATLIYNYYRKKDEKDSFVPKCENGGALILGAGDVSPFFGFGDIIPGQSMQVLYNNLSRSPMFKQEVPQTDFLVIRHTYHGATKYYLREIPNIYVTGQCFPVQEVPRPQARKITQSLKMRLQVASYRIMRTDSQHRLQYEKLRQQFPMFTDVQIKQKLKEFAQYLKKGENTGWWKLKNNLVLLDEDGIRKMVSPESICLQESTLHGAQRLKDAGYGAEDLKELADEENESALDVEVQLAPWTTTKNFIIAASGKGMIQLFGPGDPTGIGEGFSYARASMKEMFFHHSETAETRNAFVDNKSKVTFHKYSIIEQQKVYRHEIDRIWSSQLKSLSALKSEYLANQSISIACNEELASSRTNNDQNIASGEDDGQFDVSALSTSAPCSPPTINNDDAFSDIRSLQESSIAGKNKMLVINRLVSDENGSLDWKSEVITDGRVINAYLRHRKMIEKIPVIVEGVENLDSDPKIRNHRRTNAHIVRLQIKQGKKSPLINDEDVSESELPAEVIPKLIPVVIKAPVGVTAQASKKKRSTEFPLVYKVATKRRTSPECDLAEILEKVIASIIDVPEAFPFCRPVSQFNFPDYYDIVKNPLSFEQIRDKVRNFKYTSTEMFLHDLITIVDNCSLYNGPAHPLSNISHSLYEKGIKLLLVEKEKVEKLEAELIGEKPEAGNDAEVVERIDELSADKVEDNLIAPHSGMIDSTISDVTEDAAT